jgi:hypothetical protein
MPGCCQNQLVESTKLTGLRMREIQAAEAKTHLPHSLMTSGSMIVINRHGRAIARVDASHRCVLAFDDEDHPVGA